jgi:hypothetical protein
MSEDGRVYPTDSKNFPADLPMYKFEAGPSLYSGLSQERSPNPLKNVFQMIGTRLSLSLLHSLSFSLKVKTLIGSPMTYGLDFFQKLLKDLNNRLV